MTTPAVAVSLISRAVVHEHSRCELCRDRPQFIDLLVFSLDFGFLFPFAETARPHTAAAQCFLSRSSSYIHTHRHRHRHRHIAGPCRQVCVVSTYGSLAIQPHAEKHRRTLDYNVAPSALPGYARRRAPCMLRVLHCAPLHAAPSAGVVYMRMTTRVTAPRGWTNRAAPTRVCAR